MNFESLEFNNKEPIYLQIVEWVKKSIASGDLQPGDKLPSVREMSTLIKVNPNTLQRAYTELERQQITVTKRGMGSFVSTVDGHVSNLKQQLAKEIIEKFLSDLSAAGITKAEAIKLIEEME
ncbi:MAG TPA: GntR family transcriptional regulator [Firmicutes bacterium]|nr:GntR family transcriptional regulator [Bacillota bacterium]